MDSRQYTVIDPNTSSVTFGDLIIYSYKHHPGVRIGIVKGLLTDGVMVREHSSPRAQHLRIGWDVIDAVLRPHDRFLFEVLETARTRHYAQ